MLVVVSVGSDLNSSIVSDRLLIESKPSYRVRVVERSGIELDADLEPALEEDMPSRSSPDWTFDWRGFWQNADFDCEAIVKLSCRGEVFGLVRFGLYPFVDNAPPQ